MYGVVVLPSTTDVGPSILTYAVCVSGSVGTVSSVIVVVTDDFVESTLTSSNPPFVIVLIVTVKSSAPSAMLSSIVAILNVADVSPFGITTLATPVKSVPSIALPLYVNVTVKSDSGA